MIIPATIQPLPMISMQLEHIRQEVRHFYQSYAEELREAFRGGLLHEFTQLRQFVAWKAQEIDGKLHKPPYSPIYHRLADTANPASWGTLDQALQALSTGSYNGIGFVFSNTDPYAGMDFDHCVGTNQSINKRERDSIDFLQTHTHYSPRDGVHVLFEIDKKHFPGQNRKVGTVEFFKSNHYLTITPRLVPHTPKTIEQRHVEAAYLFLSLFPTESGQDRNTRADDGALQLWTPAVSDRIPVSEHIEHGGVVGSGDILAELLPAARNHRRLRELLNGDMTSCDNDHSRADWNALAMLLHWTGDDDSLTRNIFLASQLGQRAKAWDEQGIGRRGEESYLDRTIRRIREKRLNQPMKR